MKYFISILFFLLCSLSLSAQGIITIRLSYKIIRNPNNGGRPTGVLNSDLMNNVRDMNVLMDATWRGFRFDITEIVEVGGINDDFSEDWYNTEITSSNKDQMESDAKAKPGTYAWRSNAINIYINQGEGSAICSFPEMDNIIVVGGHSDYFPARHVHEIGHYFDLCHTQGCPCGSCDGSKTGQCHTVPGDDKVPDTLPDLACWGRNNISNNTYGTNYNNLNGNQQAQVDNVFQNIMSYHSTRIRLTEGQLDRWTDVARGSRDHVTDRDVYFVGFNPLFIANGSSVLPYKTIASGVNGVKNGDVLVVKPGAYNEQLTITKRMSIRATRAGAVTIGSNTQALSQEALAELKQEAEIKDSVSFARIEQNMEDVNARALLLAEEEEAQILLSPENLKVFPNPNGGIFTLSLDLPDLQGKTALLTLYNDKGEVVHTQEVHSSEDLKINLQSRHKGVYLARLSVSGEAEIYQRVVYQ